MINDQNIFTYKWYLKDGYKKENGLKVFGTFICGGGSTMGYNIAGFNHLGGVEIDTKIASVYKANHNPKYLFIESITDFNKRTNIPKELFEIDILDGSPPCSSFSMAGNREKDWGKSKKFKEGQANQVLDDLFFHFINTAEILKPKVIIAENVKGLISGNAKNYVNKINNRLKSIGYSVQLFLFDASTMGVPQRRKRVFFICSRNDLKLPKLVFKFNDKPILFDKIIDRKDNTNNLSDYVFNYWKQRIKKDMTIGDIAMRVDKKLSGFTNPIFHCDKIPQTITSSGSKILYDIPRYLNKNEICQISSFTLDYNFLNQKPEYICGMSVPPLMTAQIANQIYLQWFSKIL